jgi:hypothetical protein
MAALLQVAERKFATAIQFVYVDTKAGPRRQPIAKQIS